MVAELRPRLPLSERLRPERLSGLLGNPNARSELRSWAERWLNGVPSNRRAAMLVGPPGVGKTTAAIALAREFGWSFVEMNASEARNQSAIEQIAGRASVSHGLDANAGGRGSGRTLILLDEADCLSGRATERARPVPEPVGLNQFLQRRYSTVEALNAAWGLSREGKSRPFADWSAVPRSPGRHGWASLPAARRDLEDWRGAAVVSDTSDRGGLGAIASLVRTTRQPLLLTVNDDRPLTRYSPVFRSQVARIRFYPIRDNEVRERLATIASSERIALGPGVLEVIVGRSRGDFRAALNDLEAIAPLPAGPAQREALGTRDLADDFTGFTTEALSRPRYFRSVEVQDRLDAPPDELLPWIEENIDRYAAGPDHRDRAFRVLGVADLFLHRARRARVWGLWSYASELLSGGVGLAARDRPTSAGGVAQFPYFLAEMGRTRSLRAVRASIAGKLGKRFHLSKAKAVLLLVPVLEQLLPELASLPAGSPARAGARTLVAELSLTAEELTQLLGDRADADLVEELLRPDDDARESPKAPSSEEPSSPSEPGERGEPAARRAVQRSLSEFGRN